MITKRAAAQGFIHVVTYGVGQLIGSWAAGYVVERYTVAGDPARESAAAYQQKVEVTG